MVGGEARGLGPARAGAAETEQPGARARRAPSPASPSSSPPPSWPPACVAPVQQYAIIENALGHHEGLGRRRAPPPGRRAVGPVQRGGPGQPGRRLPRAPHGGRPGPARARATGPWPSPTTAGTPAQWTVDQARRPADLLGRRGPAPRGAGRPLGLPPGRGRRQPLGVAQPAALAAPLAGHGGARGRRRPSASAARWPRPRCSRSTRASRPPCGSSSASSACRRRARRR